MSFSRITLIIALATLVSACQTGRLAGHRSLNSTPHGYSVSNELTRAGEYAQRFEVRAGDCGYDDGWSDCDNDRERSEITLRQSITPGGDQWIGFSLYLPNDFVSSSYVNTTLGQIHQRGGPRGKAAGLPSFPPLVQLEAKADKYRACIHILSGSASDVRDICKYVELANLTEMRGRWTDVLIHLDTNNDSSHLEIFVNNQRKVDLKDFITFWPSDFYVKYGIYRSFVSRHPGAMPMQYAYFDEVKMGQTKAEVAVKPDHPVD